MHTSETFFPKKRGIDTNPPATKKTSTERKTSPMLVVLAHLARQCANCEQNSLGAPAEAQSYWQGRCPCTLQGEIKRDEVPLDPSAQLSWSLSHALPACLSSFALTPCKPHAHRQYTAAANTPSPNSHVPHGSSKSAAALPPDECAFPPAYRQYQSPRPPECSPPRRFRCSQHWNAA